MTGTTELFNLMFEADELDDMKRFFNTTNCSSSYIINVADSEKALSYEWCPIGVKLGGDDLEEGLLVSTNYYLNPEWEFPVPADEDCWNGITRRNNLISLCKANKGKIDADCMMNIMETPVGDGGALSDITVYQLVVIPETFTVWTRVIHSPKEEWAEIDLSRWLK